MIVLVLSVGCLPIDGNKFGGELGKYWCMPGPLAGEITPDFCSTELNASNDEQTSLCLDNTIFIKSPEYIKKTSFAHAKVGNTLLSNMYFSCYFYSFHKL